MNVESFCRMVDQVRPYLRRCSEFATFHGVRLMTAIRDHFVPRRGETGIRAVGSRFANLWKSGAYGKSAIVMVCLACLVFLLMMRSDNGFLVPQSGNRPRGWYDKFEEEPYGLIGEKGLRPVGRDENGLPMFRSIPALSEVKSAFCVDASCGFMLPSIYVQPFASSTPSSVFRFPPASDRAGRIEACKNYQLKQMAERQKLEMRRRVNGMLHDMRMRSLDADIASAGRLLDNENKRRSIMNRQHDYDMTKASGMTLKQWDTFKRTYDATSLDKNGLYKGADGETYQIDSSGFKWWLYKGNRIPAR